MAAPTVLTIATPPVQHAVRRVLPLRRRAYQAVVPAITTKKANETATVAATKTIAVPLANYARAATLYASGLPAWLTQDWAASTLTLSKAAAAGAVGTYPISIHAQDATGRTVTDRFLLTVS